jgi:hypothetical protein
MMGEESREARDAQAYGRATTVYLERRATGSLADLHLHLHAGPLPVARSIWALEGRR